MDTVIVALAALLLAAVVGETSGLGVLFLAQVSLVTHILIPSISNPSLKRNLKLVFTG